MCNGYDENMPPSGDFRDLPTGIIRLIVCWDDLTFREGDIAFVANRHDEMFSKMKVNNEHGGPRERARIARTRAWDLIGRTNIRPLINQFKIERTPHSIITYEQFPWEDLDLPSYVGFEPPSDNLGYNVLHCHTRGTHTPLWACVHRCLQPDVWLDNHERSDQTTMGEM